MAVGILEVQIVDAKGLGDQDFLGGMDPYVLIQFKNQERKSTVAKGVFVLIGRGINVVNSDFSTEGGNPTWNERFTFRVEYPEEGDDNQYKLTLKIMDKDTFTADDFVGQATVFLEDLLASGVENGKAELPEMKYRVIHSDESYLGEITISLTFIPKEQEDESEAAEFGGWRQSRQMD